MINTLPFDEQKNWLRDNRFPSWWCNLPYWFWRVVGAFGTGLHAWECLLHHTQAEPQSAIHHQIFKNSLISKCFFMCARFIWWYCLIWTIARLLVMFILSLLMWPPHIQLLKSSCVDLGVLLQCLIRVFHNIRCIDCITYLPSENSESWIVDLFTRVSERGLCVWHLNGSCDMIVLIVATRNLFFRCPHSWPEVHINLTEDGKRDHCIYYIIQPKLIYFSCDKGGFLIYFPILLSGDKTTGQTAPKYWRRPWFSYDDVCMWVHTLIRNRMGGLG